MDTKAINAGRGAPKALTMDNIGAFFQTCKVWISVERVHALHVA